MGREVRRVPPNWEHPQAERPSTGLQPMYDKEYTEAAEEWLQRLDNFRNNVDGERDDAAKSDCFYLWDWDGGPPDKKYHRPWKTEEATWFQVWETVTEGTPVTPPFATKEELVQYLADHGDDWSKRRGDGGWGIERARAFVESEWAPSMAIINGEFLESKDVALALKNEKEQSE